MATSLKAALSHFCYAFSVTDSISQSLRYIFSVSPLIRLRLDGMLFCIRNNTVDRDVFVSTFFHGYHRCPFSLGKEPVIVDLGSNIGLTLIDFKRLYKNARLIGAEMDEENYNLACKNLQHFQNCTVEHLAIWKETGFVCYAGENAQAFTVNEKGEGKSVRAVSLSAFFQRHRLSRVDYLKMDIEGAEQAVLCDSYDLNWLRLVRYLGIEVHDDRYFQSITATLIQHGFAVFRQSNHWSSLFAINQNQGA